VVAEHDPAGEPNGERAVAGNSCVPNLYTALDQPVTARSGLAQAPRIRVAASQQDQLAFLLAETLSHVPADALATLDAITVTNKTGGASAAMW